MKQNICILILVLIVAFILGYFYSLSYAAPAVCCNQCTNYCKCVDGTKPQHNGCYTEACPTGTRCSGVGEKCCWPGSWT